MKNTNMVEKDYKRLCQNTCVKMKPLGLNFDRFFHKIKWANKMGGGGGEGAPLANWCYTVQ
jgi:hypothetical protein